MKVYLNEVTGLADALVSMYMSKRTWTRELEEEIRLDCSIVEEVMSNKYVREHYSHSNNTIKDRMDKRLNSFCKFAWKHTTMLDFITISVTVEGLHRAGQDDWDAHACRFNNRIIRSSTRLADFSENELSDYYKDKVIPTESALDMLEKCNLAQWAHVYKMRNKNSGANPEVKEVAEAIQDAVEEILPWFDRAFIDKISI